MIKGFIQKYITNENMNENTYYISKKALKKSTIHTAKKIGQLTENKMVLNKTNYTIASKVGSVVTKNVSKKIATKTLTKMVALKLAAKCVPYVGPAFMVWNTISVGKMIYKGYLEQKEQHEKCSDDH